MNTLSKKTIQDFLSSEEGKISKKVLVGLGVAFAGIGSQISSVSAVWAGRCDAQGGTCFTGRCDAQGGSCPGMCRCGTTCPTTCPVCGCSSCGHGDCIRGSCGSSSCTSSCSTQSITTIEYINKQIRGIHVLK